MSCATSTATPGSTKSRLQSPDPNLLNTTTAGRQRSAVFVCQPVECQSHSRARVRRAATKPSSGGADDDGDEGRMARTDLPSPARLPSLPGIHPAPSQFQPGPDGSGASSARSPAPATWWRSATWTRATGRPTSPADQPSVTRCYRSSCISNLMAMVLQSLAAKLGIVTGLDLAQACREHYSPPVRMALWVMCEMAIIACDLAEVLGTAIALQLLFGISLGWGVRLTPETFADPGPAAAGLSAPRGVHRSVADRDRGLLRGRTPSSSSQSVGDLRWPGAPHRDRHRSRHALYRDRDHRRDGDAA